MKRRLAIIFVLLLALSFCHIQKEPGKIWNLRGKILQLAENLQGLPYQFGGGDIDGFDCSGLVHYVYDCFGITLPRSAQKQAKLKQKVNLKRAKPADILIFKIKGTWHTGIYTGKNTFIHAPKQNTTIRQEPLNQYWKKHLKTVIQIIKE